MSFKTKVFAKLSEIGSKVLPKYNRAVVVGFPNTESGAIRVANYIAEHYQIPVTYCMSGLLKDDPKLLLSKRITILDSTRGLKAKLSYFYQIMTSRYIFFTHSLPFISFSDRQLSINLWHGVLYKKLGLLIGGSGVKANITVGTSPLTQKMFSEAFGVPVDSVYNSGYPRNDTLLRSKREKESIKEKLPDSFKEFDKIIIWLPTYRKNAFNHSKQDGDEAGNPFYIDGFSIDMFEQILAKHNVLCLVKPHPMAVRYQSDAVAHVKFIDDKWIADQGLDLYQVVGLSDMLISDVSSIVIDYMLLDQPIFCINTDFESYKNTRGFYFEDIEKWLPNILTSQKELFNCLDLQLSTGHDPFMVKRQELKNKFFTHQDEMSTKRLLDYVFSLKFNNAAGHPINYIK